MSDYDYNQNPSENDNTNPQPSQPNPQESGSYHYTGANIPGQNQPGGYPYSGYYANPNPNPNPNPMSGYNVSPTPSPKKSGGGKKIVAIAIVCALVGGLGGGAAVGMALKGSGSGTTNPDLPVDSSTLEAQAEEPVEASDEAATAFNNTVIDVTTNSQETAMTPQDVYEHYANSVVAISNEGTTTNAFGQVSATASSGSGFIISEDGYIVTNNHVVSGAQTLTVTMTNGEEYEAQIIGADSENDVALIKIDATGLPAVSIGDSDTIEVGQQVCAIGNPLGELTNTLTVGYVSALDREINENGIPINMFQTDCAINSGNSGGPIFDMHGNVIGITTAKYSANGFSSGASIEGIGFCIPANDAMDIVSDLLQYGYVKGRASMGITCETISSTVIQYYNLPDGVLVRSVQEGSAADKAGLQEADIISEIDGEDISGVTDLKLKLKGYEPGDTAKLKVYRSETAETLEISIVFDEMESTQTQTQQTQQTQQLP